MNDQGVEVEPLSGALGAELRGTALDRLFDEAAPDNGAMGALRAALGRYMVVVLRNLELTPEQQIRLTRGLGPILRVPYIAPLADYPDIVAVLKEQEERQISTFGGTWHSDFSFLEAPPSFTLLYAREVPPWGGDTVWANMARAYEGLSAGLRALIDPLRALHSGTPHGTGGPPPGLAVSRSVKMTRGDPAADREVAHPLVRRHAETDRRSLFLNPVYTTRLADMSPQESRPLLDYLQRQAVREDNTCRLRWAPGTLAIWDNRCTQHLAINDYDGRRRLLHRTTVAGERPLGPN